MHFCNHTNVLSCSIIYYYSLTKDLSSEYVGSLLRYFNVEVIPGFPDARICGRLPRFGTLVPGAGGPESMRPWYFSRT